MQAVLLPAGQDVYAVLVDWVREVVTAPPLTALVTGPELVLGLSAVGTAEFAVVVRSQQGLAGLTATAFPRRALLGSPSGPSDLPGTAGTYQVGRQVVVLLDPATLLASQRLGGHHPQNGTAPVGAV